MSQITPSQSKCNIALPGINQIYYIEKEHLTNESLVALFLSELKQDNILTNESYDYIKELSSRKSDFNETYKAFTDKLSSYSDNLNKLTQCVNGNDKDTINSSINRIYNIINNTEVI